MSYQVKTEQFEGPFPLLLSLIEEQKMDITKISLAKITEQYLKHLEKIEELYPLELADFLVVATKLLLIKSHALLPYLALPEAEETNLAEQLKIYKEYYEAAGKMEQIIKARNFTYPRMDNAFLSPEVVFSPPKSLQAGDLFYYFQDVLSSLEPVIKLPKAAIAKAVTLKEKIFQLQQNLAKCEKLSFKELMASSENKTEIIVTFLALLEMVKEQYISVNQEQSCSDIIIEKLKN